MSACTGRTNTISTRALIPKPTCGGGPTASAEWRSQGLDVFAYFNNDGYGHAVRNARRLRELVGS